MRLRFAATVGVDEESGRPLLPHSRRGVRQLQDSSQAAGVSSSSSSMSSSSSGSYDNVDFFQDFALEAYEEACPSVPTLVSNCNATVIHNEVSVMFGMPCIVGPEDSGVEGSCQEPYGDFDSYRGLGIKLESHGIEEVQSLQENFTSM